MIKNKTSLLILAMAAALIVTGGGCASLNLTPDNLLPKSIAPAGTDLRFDGTVNVQADVPGISRGKVALFHSGNLRVALEKAIAQKELFRRIEQGDADYVLDVWVDDATRRLEFMGEGYIIDMTAVWRLTRSKGGKVIVCDDSNGHGASHAVGTNAYVAALETATREMIKKGLSLLSDRPAPAPAMCLADDWPSMGSVIPEGYKQFGENWSKLREGMTEDEVLKMIPSMKFASRNTKSDFRVGPGGTSGSFSSQYIARFYALTFVNGGLQRWELRR